LKRAKAMDWRALGKLGNGRWRLSKALARDRIVDVGFHAHFNCVEFAIFICNYLFIKINLWKFLGMLFIVPGCYTAFCRIKLGLKCV